MKTATRDITAMVRKWSPKQRQAVLAVLLRDQVEKKGTEMVPIVDEKKETIAYLMPRLRVVESVIDETTEYGREMRRRIDTLDDSIPVEELNAQLDREENRKRRSR